MTTTAPPAPSPAAAAVEPLRPDALRVERHFRAPPERVFRAWTAAEELRRWSDPDPRDAEAEVDLRVGGRYRIAMARADGTVHRVTGVYREIDPPRRLVYTWRWESMPGSPETVVTVDFRARPDGGTDLVLVHEGLPSDDARARHAHGWGASIDKLAAVVGEPAGAGAVEGGARAAGA